MIFNMFNSCTTTCDITRQMYMSTKFQAFFEIANTPTHFRGIDT